MLSLVGVATALIVVEKVFDPLMIALTQRQGLLRLV
jgi:hypothetical protein